MTSINAFSKWELIHEFDTSIMSNDDFHTFSNAGEIMPEPLTPLSISTLLPSIEGGLFGNVVQFMKESKFYYQMIGISHSRVQFCVFNLILRIVKMEITIENKLQSISLCGHEFITEQIHKIGLHRHGAVSKSEEWKLLCLIIKFAWNNKKEIKRLDKFMGGFIGTYNGNRLDRFPGLLDLYEEISNKIDVNFLHVVQVHCRTTTLSSVFEVIMFRILAKDKTELTPELISDITTLLSACKNAESAEIPTALEKITKSICECKIEKIQEFCSIEADYGVEWLKQNCIDAHEGFQRFIERNGHRGLQEVIEFVWIDKVF